MHWIWSQAEESGVSGMLTCCVILSQSLYLSEIFPPS